MNQFAKELALIKDGEILSFTEKIIRSFPEPFWRMPASSTGKYHSDSSAGRGGLVEHTRQVFWIAKTILDTSLLNGNRDVVYSACLLHDGWKYNTTSRWTLRNHATIGANEIERIIMSDQFFVGGIVPAWYQKIVDCVRSHNGLFTKEWAGSMSMEQIIVHLADMIGSRRFLSFNAGGLE